MHDTDKRESLESRFEPYRGLIDDWDAFLEVCQRPLPLVVWANPTRLDALQGLSGDTGPQLEIDRKTEAGRLLAQRLEQRGYATEPVPWYPGALKVEGLEKPGLTLEFYLGAMHVQEEVSLLPAVVLAAKAGERVLDLCAAPGGKTAQLAFRMENRGTLVANDVRPSRLRALRSNCERLGATNVVVTPIDGTRYPLEAGPFDRILLDVPCSCEGNVRDGSRVTIRQTGFLVGRSGLQATLLGRAWKLLRPGGMLVYSTCTFSPVENEMVLDHVLGDDAEILPVSVPGLRYAAGVDQWEGQRLRPDCIQLARLWPHLNDTGGFTVALVRKSEDARPDVVPAALP